MSIIEIVVISKNDELVRLVEKVAEYPVKHFSSYLIDESYHRTIVLHDVDTIVMNPNVLGKLAKKSTCIYALASPASLPDNLDLYTDVWTDWQNEIVLQKHLSSLERIMALYDIKAMSVNFSSDILTHLRVIKGYADLFLVTSDNLTEKQQRYMDSLINCTRTIRAVIDEYNEWRSFKDGSLSFQRRHYPLSELIDAVTSSGKAHVLDILSPSNQAQINVVANRYAIVKVIHEILKTIPTSEESKVVLKMTMQAREIQFSLKSPENFIHNIDGETFSLYHLGIYDTDFIRHVIKEHEGTIWAEDASTLHFTLPAIEKGNDK